MTGRTPDELKWMDLKLTKEQFDKMDGGEKMHFFQLETLRVFDYAVNKVWYVCYTNTGVLIKANVERDSDKKFSDYPELITLGDLKAWNWIDFFWCR